MPTPAAHCPVPGPSPHVRGCLALALALLLPACGRNSSTTSAPAAPAPVAVALVPLATRSVDRFVDITGTLYGEEELTVAAEVEGRVIATHVDLGDVATSGSTLAQIEPTDYELAIEEQRAGLTAALAKLGLSELPTSELDLSQVPAVARASASLANAAARLERARKLFDRDPPMMSAQDFADIETEHTVAQTNVSVERLNAQSLLAEARVRASALRIAQQRLEDTTVVAPPEKQLNYRIAARLVSVGEIVSPGQAMFRLVASDRVKFRGAVPERLIAQIRVGARARLQAEGAAEQLEGVVARISPAVDVATRTFDVEIDADNTSATLKPGSFVRASILVGTTPDALFVPSTAVADFAGTERIYSEKDGKAVEHRVRLGPPDRGTRELLDPLPGITHIIADPRGIAPGTPVAPTRETTGR